MRAVAQRVSEASVVVDGQIVGQIGSGLLVYLGVGHDDSDEDEAKMVTKLSGVRIFGDDSGKMSRSLRDIAETLNPPARAEILVVSQFTLYGDMRRGLRPSFSSAASPQLAKQRYGGVCSRLRSLGFRVQTGVFGAMMEVRAAVAGPVTILIDTKKVF